MDAMEYHVLKVTPSPRENGIQLGADLQVKSEKFQVPTELYLLNFVGLKLLGLNL